MGGAGASASRRPRIVYSTDVTRAFCEGTKGLQNLKPKMCAEGYTILKEGIPPEDCTDIVTEKVGALGTSVATRHDRLCGRKQGFAQRYRLAVDLAATEGSKVTALSKINIDPKEGKPINVEEFCNQIRVILKEADGKLTGDQISVLRDNAGVCELETKTFAAAAAAEMIAVNIVQGTGEFLKERAQEELTAYAVDLLGSRLCEAEDAHDPSKGPLRKLLTQPLDPAPAKERFVFQRSCDLAFQDGKELEYDVFSDGRFQKVFAEELPDLPVALLGALVEHASPPGAAPLQGPELRAWYAFVKAIVREANQIRRGSAKKPLEVIQDINSAVNDLVHAEAKAFSCDLRPGKGSPLCWSLLGLETAANAQIDSTFYLDVRTSIEKGRTQFCHDYGVVDKDCVDVAKFESVEQKLRAFMDIVEQLRAISAAQDRLDDAGQTPFQIAVAILPDYAKVVKGLLDLVEVSDACTTGKSCPDEKIKQWIDVVLQANDVLARVQREDIQGAVVGIKLLVGMSPLKEVVEQRLGERGTQSLRFVLSLGAAKDSTEAKEVIKAAAEPLGSYRVKYHGSYTISLNGFVGPAGGGSFRFGANGSKNTWAGDVKPLSALVGLDLSGPIAKGWHLGGTLTLIDALGLVTVETNGTTKTDWGGVLTPGLMLRLGIAKSPVVAFASGQWQPLRQDTSATPTWREAISVYGGLAVDIPMFVLSTK